MKDVASHFREYVRLDRQRAERGLSVAELHRWRILKQMLSSHFSPGLSPGMADRRESVRVPTRVNVSFASDGELARCLMTWMSKHGVFVQTAHPLELETRFELHIQVIRPPREIVAPVEVVSVGLGPDARQRQGMGLRFLELEPKVAKQIQELYELSVS